MKICYIVGAGDFERPFSPSDDDLVIAADGGYDGLKRFNIRCDLLIGDLDSIKSKPDAKETITFPVRKDETDMHLAYLEGARRGYDVFHIYGGTGGREDHTFANYCLLKYIREDGRRATLFSNNADITLIKNEEITVTGEAGKHLSLFPFGSDGGGVSVLGAEYECENKKIFSSFPLTVSNIFKDSPVRVRISDGALLIIKEI